MSNLHRYLAYIATLEALSATADAILFEVGYRHWVRMNAVRCPWVAATRPVFLRELEQRISDRNWVHRWNEVSDQSYYAAVRDYLTKRLTPKRLALPVDYNLADQVELSTGAA